MFGKLRGIIDSIDDDIALMDVNGVGYEVACAPRTLAMLAPGEAAELIIETHVREDAIRLFGFATHAERGWFRLLSTVQRVGAKAALSILNVHTPEALVAAIAAQDTTAFSKISGIGPKLAERIVAELKDKVVGASNFVPRGKEAASRTTTHEPRTTHLQDTVSALTHLGYSRTDAYAAAVRAVKNLGEDAAVDALIKGSLKELAG